LRKELGEKFFAIIKPDITGFTLGYTEILDNGKLKRIFMALLLLCPPLFIYVVFIEPHMLRLRQNKLSTPEIFKNLKGLRILHISDLHIKKIGVREKKILKYIEKTKPHIILITGDYLDYKPKVDVAVRFVRMLHAPLGVWGNLGNVDYCFPKNVEKLQKALPDIILRNKIVRIEWNNSPFWVVGIDDPILYKMPTYEKKLAELISSVPAGEPYIALLHRPEQIPIVTKLGAKFILCGHTHGGQLRLPFSMQFYNQSETCKKYAHGMFVSKNSIINVSKGIGTSDIPMRFLCHPEVVVLEFV